MYGFEKMIEMGLEKGKDFPTPIHRLVAVNLAICNPAVHDMNTLKEVVSCVCLVPEHRIKTVTIRELKDEFGLPYIGF